MMRATTFIYSSHNRGQLIHRDILIQRALEGAGNILYLPISEGVQNGDEYESQKFGYDKFRWYFDMYRHTGLTSDTFYWTSGMTRDDTDALLSMIESYEVVILGGGNSNLGMRRYYEIGERFYGDRHTIGNILHQRQAQGKLTVGFSAGADQLGELLCDSVYQGHEVPGFGLAARVGATLHYEPGREQSIREGARMFPGSLWFGLPNDAGLGIQQGNLPSGAFFQVIDTVLDNTWDVPAEAFHIKTRQGVGVKHFYADGREWDFYHGDRIVRVMHGDYHGCWIAAHGRIYDYYSQHPTHFGSIGDILGSHS